MRREITDPKERAEITEQTERLNPFRLFRYFRPFFWIRDLSSFFIALSFLTSGCSHRDPEPERRAAVESTISKIRSCAPENRPDDKLRLAIADVKIEPQHTSVRLVAYAFDQAIDFDLPVYIMSRGRWMINDVGRAYLLDEHCSEYRLRDRRSSSGQAVPLDGRIRLNPGQAFEAILNFQRLPDQTRMGVLVYGNNTLSFMLWDQAQ